MPAVVNNTVGSFSGMTEAPEIIVCPLLSKNFRYISRNASAVSLAIVCSFKEVKIAR